MQATNRRFRIFTDRAFLPEGFEHCAMLRPHWGDTPGSDAYDRYTRIGDEFQELVPPEEAEVALLPFDTNYLHNKPQPIIDQARATLHRFVDRARELGLRPLILNSDDDSLPLGIPEALVLRNSLDRRRRPSGDFAMPGWFDDYVTRSLGGSVILRDKAAEPVVGFCGMSAKKGPPLKRRIKSFASRTLRNFGVHIAQNEGVYLRRRAMLALENQPGIRTNFIAHEQFFGGGSVSEGLRPKARQDYYENFISSDYGLAVRGFGNFSFRFYEIMAAGRIPVLIDTDCVLPYDFLHDYREFCVIVPENEIDRVGDYVLRFHAQFSPDDFRDLQIRIRRFWEEWLSPEGFYRNVPLHLEATVAAKR